MSHRRSSATPLHICRVALVAALLVITGMSPCFGQKAEASTPPKYDTQTETKAKGTVEEIKLFSLGTRKDYTELILKDGPSTLQIYVSPKPFQDEMGISFAKGDEISVTGSKVKQEDAEVILAREIIKGTDTLMFRDDKGKPVWNEHTGK